jgi:hypothetical protein
MKPDGILAGMLEIISLTSLRPSAPATFDIKIAQNKDEAIKEHETIRQEAEVRIYTDRIPSAPPLGQSHDITCLGHPNRIVY